MKLEWLAMVIITVLAIFAIIVLVKGGEAPGSAMDLRGLLGL
jgi:hypothetical protein